MRQSKITYYPSLSVNENAKKNGVSEAAIRYYIKANHIDRRAEEKAQIIADCRKYFAFHPKASKSKVARETKYGLSTIRKYWDYIATDKPFVDFDRNKAKERQEAVKSPDKVEANRYELWSDILKEIPNMFRLAETEDIKGLRKFFREKPEMPMLFIGSGGQQGCLPALLYSMNGGIGKGITPYTFPSISDNALKHTRVLLMSKGGRNDDIVYASRRAVDINPTETACLTFHASEENRMMKVLSGTGARIFLFNHPELKDGFTSVRGKFYKLGLLYRAFTGEQEILPKLKVELEPDKCFQYKLNREGVDLPNLRQIKHFLVLYGGFAEPVAVDFESVMAETGIASVQVCDYRNFCHGRFVFASNHTQNYKEPQVQSDAAMVMLISPRERKIATDMLKNVIPARMPVILIETEHNSPLAILDLEVKTNVLIGEIGEKAYGINPYSPPNYSDIDKRVPINNIKFTADFNVWGNLTYKEPDRSYEIALKQQIDEYIRQEHENTSRLEQIAQPQQRIDKADIWKKEQYNASTHLCYAFRKKEDLHKDVYVPLGNMNSGFPYKIAGVKFNQSEGAYISGMFSDNTPEHIAVQQELAVAKSGMDAKKDIRHRYQSIARKDWYDFNVEWMVYCVWRKCKGSKKFRDLLLAIPREAIIIEDTSFQPKRPNDTAAFWGCRNTDIKTFNDLVEDYVNLTNKDKNKTEKGRIMQGYRNDFCNYGVFRGTNAMGKILMLCKQCLHEGTAPDIDYELLKSKNIFICGKRLDFDK